MSGYRKPMTLDRVKVRCRVCGDCWEWQGATNGVGHPKVAWLTAEGKTHKSARRVVWEVVRGPLTDKQLVTVSCDNQKCLNPAHLKLTTKSAVAKKNNAKTGTSLKRRASVAKTNRVKFGKITMEIAREIRASEKSGVELAREFDCSVSLISHVRVGRSWVEHSSPFAGLGAR